MIWVHAASVGEVTAARGLIDTLLARDPRLRLVVTTNTITGRAVARGWAVERIEARLAPLDYRWALHRFLAGWQPTALVTVENEIWPNRMATGPCPPDAGDGRRRPAVGAQRTGLDAGWAGWPGRCCC